MVREELFAYYRAYSGDPNILEKADVDKASYDWANDITAPGFDSPITRIELLTLVDELSMTKTKKAVGDAVGFEDVTVEHKGEAVTVTVQWLIMPGKTGAGYYYNRSVSIASLNFTIPRSPNNGDDWETLSLGDWSGTYPNLSYDSDTNKADCWMQIRNASNPLIIYLNQMWDDVYELAPPAIPAPQFRNITGKFT